jgi:hypothetical protein
MSILNVRKHMKGAMIILLLLLSPLLSFASFRSFLLNPKPFSLGNNRKKNRQCDVFLRLGNSRI